MAKVSPPKNTPQTPFRPAQVKPAKTEKTEAQKKVEADAQRKFQAGSAKLQAKLLVYVAGLLEKRNWTKNGIDMAPTVTSFKAMATDLASRPVQHGPPRQNIKPGDIIVMRKGMSKFTGMGRVTGIDENDMVIFTALASGALMMAPLQTVKLAGEPDAPAPAPAPDAG